MKEKIKSYLQDLMLFCIEGRDSQKVLDKTLERYTDKFNALIPQWIPVGERLPEEHEDYLVVIDKGDERDVRTGFTAEGMWFVGNMIYTNGEVTHWQNLPELPEGK